ncbi:hypothetical protein HZU73_02170 [Apis mellifera caucasica]|uniref:Uncharacterized protein LOC102654309 n=1 Tax=Apis mellifera TaxID=7460 RepID=A0A7M7KYA4_APIME|nr:uncharacterized protein LOC102654309 [Apis mellifera]KAG6802483.1 hypothetical protein HZU73_02170 [Apis mellifera caucasica]KAG9435457.1 hypothetical protein HZU67_03442 [Apis mellifera carnica]|eukprot:XP_026294927.1 uncharacterized protein LOC102654309 [Apis mellifera]
MLTDKPINECVCPRCLHSSCPLPNAEPPYDEITQEISNNFISVKVPKCKRKFEKEDEEDEEKLSFDFNCADAEGEKCKTGCTKVHVIPNEHAPPKKPEEEMLSLKSIRHIMPNDILDSTVEIEFKAARNYNPLPEPGPPPPIIVPRQRIKKKKGKSKKK